MDCLAHQGQSTFLEHRWLSLGSPWKPTQSEKPPPAPRQSGCLSDLQDELWMTEE